MFPVVINIQVPQHVEVHVQYSAIDALMVIPAVNVGPMEVGGRIGTLVLLVYVKMGIIKYQGKKTVLNVLKNVIIVHLVHNVPLVQVILLEL